MSVTGRPASIGVVMALAACAAGAVGHSGAASTPGAGAGTAAVPRAPEATGIQEPSPRVQLTLNDGWRYADGPLEGAEAPTFDDRAWERVDLPHTWNAADALSEAPDYRRGVGWYRKTLRLDPSLEGKRLFLRFEGANQVADVWVNGRAAGRHIGGYTAFAFDLTGLVRWDGANVIAVRVDNAHDDDIPPLNADFTFYGGIYRDAWLVATEPVHVTVLDHGSPGVFIDTPEISADAATVRVRGTLVNATGTAIDAEVVSRVRDPDGREVAALRTTVRVPASGSAPFEQRARVDRPRLWSPDDPAVHRVITEVRAGGRRVDLVESPLGFRWLAVDPDRGVLLNGAPLPLIGTNRHQDWPGYGNAVPDALHRRDVALVKATGFNFLRLAHYPQDPAVLEAMDRLGLVGWEEIPVVNIITLSEAFADNAERMLVEMIRQHYNHPSIGMWGYMNEVMLRIPDPIPPGYYERVVALAERLDSVARAEDPFRPTATAISFDEIDNGTGYQDIADILGLNLYFGWYYRSLEGLGPFLDSLHARHPDRPLMISEYGAGSDERIHTTAPVAFDFSTEHQQRFHESHLPQLLEREWLAGTGVWNQFDFGSRHRHDSKPNINQKGLLYFDRTPKDIEAYYRAILRSEPVLHIATRDWPRRAGSAPGDRRQPVVVYTNQRGVELSVNGRPQGPPRDPDNATIRWEATLDPGENRLRARAAGAIDETVILYEDRSGLFTGLADATSPVADGVTMAVNAGSHYLYTEPDGPSWEADRPYATGGWGHVGGRNALVHHRITGTAEEGLYQATREGVEAYRFDVVDGLYEVTLAFTETRHDRPGQRVFSVRINGQTVFADLDLAADHGRYVALERRIIVPAGRGEGLVVELEASAGETTISAIALRRM